jgi:hypothetical protein
VFLKYVGQYISGYDEKMVKFVSGDIMLEKVKINENFLDSLNLPLTIKFTHLACLKLKIPWTKL